MTFCGQSLSAVFARLTMFSTTSTLEPAIPKPQVNLRGALAIVAWTFCVGITLGHKNVGLGVQLKGVFKGAGCQDAALPVSGKIFIGYFGPFASQH